MATTKQTIIGDSASAQKAYADLARQVAKLEEANQKLGTATDKITKEGVAGQNALSGALLRQIGTLASSAGAVMSLEQAWQVATAAAKEYLAVSDRINQTKIDFARGETILGLNTLNQKDFEQYRNDALKIADLTGFSNVGTLTEAMGTAVNAAPGRTPEEQRKNAYDAVLQGASLTKHRPELLDSFVGGALDVATSAGVSPAEANSLNLTAGRFARISNPERQQRAISQTVASMVASSNAKNDDEKKRVAESAAEFWAGANKAAKDSLGERSRTFSEQFGSHAQQAFTEGIDVMYPGRTRPMKIKPKNDPGDPVGRLEYLQSDPRFAKAFLSKYSFESGYKDQIAQAIRDPEHSEMAQAIRAARSPVGYDDKIYGSAKAVIESGSETLKLAGQDEASKTHDTVARIQGFDQRALASQAIKTRNTALETTSGWGAGGWLLESVLGGMDRTMKDQFTPDSMRAEQASSELEFKLKNVRARTHNPWSSTPDVPTRDYTTEEKNVIKVLEHAIRDLQPLLERQNELTRLNLEETKGKKPTAAGPTRAEAGKGRER